MNPENALNILHQAINAAIAKGVYQNTSEVGAIIQSLQIIDETIKEKKNDEKIIQKH
jgi:hypothetical protein